MNFINHKILWPIFLLYKTKIRRLGAFHIPKRFHI